MCCKIRIIILNRSEIIFGISRVLGGFRIKFFIFNSVQFFPFFFNYQRLRAWRIQLTIYQKKKTRKQREEGKGKEENTFRYQPT